MWERLAAIVKVAGTARGSLAAFAATLLIGVIGFYVMEGLAQTAKLEDCLLQGRLNCERIDISSLRTPIFPQ